MGSSASSNPGVSANPRLVYADNLSKKVKKNLSIDAPVLVDFQHGSVRYRYGQYAGAPTQKAKRKERTFEGEEEKTEKRHYFYHPRLKDFSENASEKKEDEFKFLYVAKGPARAKQKMLYYVYRKGWGAMDGLKTEPSKTIEPGHDYAWPNSRRNPFDVYYQLEILDSDVNEEDYNYEKEHGGAQVTSMTEKILLILKTTDTVADIKVKLGARIVKSPKNIHIWFQKEEIQDTNAIGEYIDTSENITSENSDNSKTNAAETSTSTAENQLTASTAENQQTDEKEHKESEPKARYLRISLSLF
ncbi:hypothetical protein CHS0354_011351 [Potamilus streckersoni]|uniref:Ubiquitin-like domain-containing protein n=1 Tax=Potamilus streckersoni TaxID=2493646 RepID=A0AAE0WDB7_9BIVA|nr:hypothetical protein CHS0354_011351 [Potamilus streckersoni]